MSQGGHSEPLLLFALFYQSTTSCSQVMGGWVAHVIFVSPQVLLVLTLVLQTRAWQLTISLSICFYQYHIALEASNHFVMHEGGINIKNLVDFWPSPKSFQNFGYVFINISNLTDKRDSPGTRGWDNALVPLKLDNDDIYPLLYKQFLIYTHTQRTHFQMKE